MRKLMIILMSVVICLLSASPLLAEVFTSEGIWATPEEYEKATGNTIEKFHEAPMLRTMVAAGEIPPVSERLGKEPLVIRPLESIGEYGGTLLVIRRTIEEWGIVEWQIRKESILRRNREDLANPFPNIAKGWELSADAKSLTLYLREGIKWSDGAPFTADDIVFNFNDILQNEELSPGPSEAWHPGGERIQAEKVDKYTVKLKFALPWIGGVYALTDGWWGSQTCQWGTGAFVPAHYLKRFHIEYNSDADELAKKEGYDHWHQLFKSKQSFTQNVEVPVLSAWVVKTIAPDYITAVRNPYYWKVDTEGNQFPYIDEVKGVLADTGELRAAKILSGEPDVSSLAVDIGKYPVVMTTADKNNYRVSIEPGPLDAFTAVKVMLYFNHTLEDPFLRELFSNIKFKQALSLAINRDEVNELVYLGTAEAKQATLSSGSPYYEERFARAYAQYEPQKAKELLNEIGLKRDKDGYILRPDGKVLNLVIEVAPWYGSHTPAAELVRDYWQEIGLKTSIDHAGGGEMWDLYAANKSQISMWALDRGTYGETMVAPMWWSTCQFQGQKWQQWFATNGEKGEEPPAEMKEWYDLWQKVPYIVDEQERIRTGKRALELLSENLWFIGVVGNPPAVRLARTSLKNVNLKPVAMEDDIGVDVFQWFFEK